MTSTDQRAHLAQAIQTSAILRQAAVALRHQSELARLATKETRRGNQAVLERARLLHGLRRAGDPARGASTALAADPTVTVDELIRILVDHHGMTPFDATLELIAELVREDLPDSCHELTGALALDIVQRIMVRRP